MATILCVDDDAAVLQVVRRTMDVAGHRVIAVTNVESAFGILRTDDVDLIISDYRMPGITGLEFLQQLSEQGSAVPLIMVTGHASIEHAVASMKAGAIDYVEKPVGPEQLRLVVEQALEFTHLRRENERLRAEVAQLRRDWSVVGDSPAIRQVLDTVRMVAPTRASVLLQGESGTGKELIARALHDSSDRASGPFITINCAALPESLVESTLFGHEKGAFTGAIKQVKGAFERAHRGTLLLDEVSEMRLDLQSKLLRVLQEREFERVGGTTPIRVDVRVIATTNRDLQLDAREGRFREDLYYRLTVVPVRLPPLRERMVDVPLLVKHFIQRSARELGKEVAGIDPDALELLCAYHWPGNIRELSHAVERAVILARGMTLGAEAFTFLPAQSVTAPSRPNGGNTGAAVQLSTLNIAEAETALIEKALAATNQNRTRAAELLGISVRTLRNKLNRPDDDEGAEEV
jgi:DNA-binding NtrC family response regulator